MLYVGMLWVISDIILSVLYLYTIWKDSEHIDIGDILFFLGLGPLALALYTYINIETYLDERKKKKKPIRVVEEYLITPTTPTQEFREMYDQHLADVGRQQLIAMENIRRMGEQRVYSTNFPYRNELQQVAAFGNYASTIYWDEASSSVCMGIKPKVKSKLPDWA